MLNTGLEQSRPDLVFKHSRLRNNFILEVICCMMMILFFKMIHFAPASLKLSSKICLDHVFEADIAISQNYHGQRLVTASLFTGQLLRLSLFLCTSIKHGLKTSFRGFDFLYNGQ